MTLPGNEQDPQRVRSTLLCCSNLHLENWFEDNGAGGQHVLDFLLLEDDVFQWCLSAQPEPTALQRSDGGQSFAPLQPSALQVLGSAPFWAVHSRFAMNFPGDFVSQYVLVAPRHQATLGSTLSSKTMGCPGWPSTKCLHLSW